MRLISSITILCLGCWLTSCSESPLASSEYDVAPDLVASTNTAKVLHHVSAGGPDLCDAIGLKPGCDGNFSLTANMRSDGTVVGQWQDTFAGGGFSAHIAIDCMNIDGNSAILGGEIRRGTYPGVGEISGRAVTAVVDNGTSSNDVPDQMSFTLAEPWISFYVDTDDCQALSIEDFDGILLNVGQGQVTVR